MNRAIVFSSAAGMLVGLTTTVLVANGGGVPCLQGNDCVLGAGTTIGGHVILADGGLSAGCFIDSSGNTVCNGVVMDSGSVYVQGNYIAGSPLAPGFGGTGIGLSSTSPSVTFFQTNYQSNGDSGYQLFENNAGVLEINRVTPDNSGPQTECQFDFILTDGLPNFACVGSIGAGIFASPQFNLTFPGVAAFPIILDGTTFFDWYSCPTGNCGVFAEPWLQVKNTLGNRVQYVSIPKTVDPSNPIIFQVSDGIDAGGFLRESGPVILPAIPSLTGTRFLCIDSSGVVSSSASACSGT